MMERSRRIEDRGKEGNIERTKVRIEIKEREREEHEGIIGM